MEYNGVSVPKEGTVVTVEHGKATAVDAPIIPYIEGDGIGAEITGAMRKAVDAAVTKAYGESKRIHWYEIFAGEKANERFGSYLPEDTIQALRDLAVGIKGPLATPVGGGIRSLNVTLRQTLDLYACVRPVRYYDGVPSPLKHPETTDVVIFRENSEDVYAGIEWPKDSPQAKNIISFLKEHMDVDIRNDSGIGIKPVSETGTKRLVRMAIQFALDEGRKKVTIMHKGNIMKFTEGAFRSWGYEVARDEFGDVVVTEDEIYKNHGAVVPDGKLLINDRIADNMFQQILINTADYDVVATLNLNGDYFSDGVAAQVGGLGMAPGGNIGDSCALFEATHGTAPDRAGKDMANPGSIMLSAKMMLDFIGFDKAGSALEAALQKTILDKTVTDDLAKQMDGATTLTCSAFTDALIANL